MKIRITGWHETAVADNGVRYTIRLPRRDIGLYRCARPILTFVDTENDNKEVKILVDALKATREK